MASTGGDFVIPRCGVCFGHAGGASCGEAAFVAECSHAFHFRCVAASTAGACPICTARWRRTLVVTLRPAPPMKLQHLQVIDHRGPQPQAATGASTPPTLPPAT
ncbi:unnamed protein product [Urochloa humidicola]